MISLSNTTISTTATAGTVVGTLALLNASRVTMGANFTLQKGCAGFFSVTNGYHIVTNVTAIPVGFCTVKVRTVGQNTFWLDKASFVITVTA